MPDTATITPTADGFVLWHRPSGRRQHWRPVGTFPTTRKALDAIRGSGDWMTLPAGSRPTDKPPPRT